MVKLTRQAEVLANQLPLTPIITRAKDNKFHDVLEAIRPMATDTKLLDITKRMPQIFPSLRTIPKFNMVESLLPREWVFDLAQAREVEKVYPNKQMHILYPTAPPDGVYNSETGAFKEVKPFTTTWQTKKLIGADEANKEGYNGTGVNTVVADTGLTRRHPATRHMFLDSTMAQVHDANGHGMWCSACVGGHKARDERLGRKLEEEILTEGMAPDTNVTGIKCLGYVIGTGSTGNIIKAMEMAYTEYNASIISMSLGGPHKEERPEDDAHYEPVKYLTERDVILSVAAGNSGPDENTVGSPGCMGGVLTVGAYDPIISGKITDFSSRGPTNWGSIKPDCVAPGERIHAPITGWLDRAGDNTNNNYSPISGTSMATPHVSGLLACMKQAHRLLIGKELNTDEVKNMLEQLGETKNNIRGWGLISWSMYKEWLETEHSTKIR